MTLPALNVSRNGVDQTSADNLNTYCQTCNIVTDLRAFIGISGVQVYMRGFTSPNDGGQGNFYWNSTGTGPDDGGVTNIVPTGSIVGCWTRILATGVGNGTVTSVSVTTANGVSGTVATPTATPAITLTLGAITPSSVAASGTVTGSNLSGTNTGNQTITLTGDVAGSGTGSFATIIGANAVLNSKFRQSVAASVVGNPTSATANVSDIQVSAGYQVLTANSTGTGISWQNSGFRMGVVTDAGATSYNNIVTYTAGPYTLTNTATLTNWIGYKITMPVLSSLSTASGVYGLDLTLPSLADSATIGRWVGINITGATFASGDTVNSSRGISIGENVLTGTATLSNDTAIDIAMPNATGASTTVSSSRGIKITLPTGSTNAVITGGTKAFEVSGPTLSGGSTIDASYGFYSNNLGTSGATISYGFYAAAQSGSTTNYAYYYASTNPWYVDQNGFTKDPGRSRVSTQFDKTDTTLANVTGLTALVMAAGVYSFRAHLTVSAPGAGGIKVAISGTATVTNISYSGWNYNGTTLNALSTTTTLGNAVGAATAVSTNIIIEGTVLIANAGTLTVQAAQNAASGTTSVLVNSKFTVERIS